MKETFKIKPPKRIAIGDPWYYEMFEGKELERLTVDFLRLNHFTAARVVIEESPIEDMPEYKSLDMTICLAPKNTIDTYLKGMYYNFQDCAERPIGVDTARYRMSVDGREDTIYTGADGIWGDVTEFSHNLKGFRILDAIMIRIGFPDEFDTFENMKERLNYFFENVQQIENLPVQEIGDDSPSMDEPSL